MKKTMSFQQRQANKLAKSAKKKAERTGDPVDAAHAAKLAAHPHCGNDSSPKKKKKGKGHRRRHKGGGLAAKMGLNLGGIHLGPGGPPKGLIPHHSKPAQSVSASPAKLTASRAHSPRRSHRRSIKKFKA
jgi:hypothetical protein